MSESRAGYRSHKGEVYPWSPVAYGAVSQLLALERKGAVGAVAGPVDNTRVGC